MKKIKFISALALTMVLASCENFDLPNPPGQTYPEPDGVFENSGIVLTQGTATVNLKEFNKNNQDVPVANVTELVNFPENYDLAIDMEVGSDANFTKVTTLNTTITDNTVLVNPDLFNGAIQEVMTKKPGNYDVATRFVAYAERGTTRMRLGGITATYCPSTFKIETLDPAKVIEDAYYLVPCTMGENGNKIFSFSKALLMNNTSGAGVSPYDNPEFAVKFDITEQESIDGYSFAVVPQSAYEAKKLAGILGTNTPVSETSGKLIPIDITPYTYPIVIKGMMGSMLLTVNIEQESFVYSYAFEVLYPFSGSTKPADLMLLYTDNYINYTGVTAINRQWTLGAQPDKNGAVIFKQDPNSEPVVSEDGLSQSGNMTATSDGTKLTAPVKGNTLYWVNVNLVQLTYELTGLTSMSVIGDGNEWNLETATPLTPSKDLKTWTAKDVEIGDEFKINCNGDWVIAFSGQKISDMNGTKVYTVNKQDGGANLQTGEKGKYDVTVNFGVYPYTVTIVKK